jgi:hypothetical protein
MEKKKEKQQNNCGCGTVGGRNGKRLLKNRLLEGGGELEDATIRSKLFSGKEAGTRNFFLIFFLLTIMNHKFSKKKFHKEQTNKQTTAQIMNGHKKVWGKNLRTRII